MNKVPFSRMDIGTLKILNDIDSVKHLLLSFTPFPECTTSQRTAREIWRVGAKPGCQGPDAPGEKVNLGPVELKILLNESAYRCSLIQVAYSMWGCSMAVSRLPIAFDEIIIQIWSGVISNGLHGCFWSVVNRPRKINTSTYLRIPSHVKFILSSKILKFKSTWLKMKLPGT